MGGPRRERWWAAAGVIAAMFLLLLWTGVQHSVPADHLLREPQTLARQPWYFGALSTLGGLLWTSAAALLFFAASRLHGEEVRFFTMAGVLTALLAADDVFLVHDQWLPAIGLDDKAAYAAYGSLLAVLCWRFRAQLRASPWPLFSLALALLGCSVLFDAAFNAQSQLVEDGAKLLGISCWSSWAWWTAARGLKGVAPERHTATAPAALCR